MIHETICLVLHVITSTINHDNKKTGVLFTYIPKCANSLLTGGRWAFWHQGTGDVTLFTPPVGLITSSIVKATNDFVLLLLFLKELIFYDSLCAGGFIRLSTLSCCLDCTVTYHPAFQSWNNVTIMGYYCDNDSPFPSLVNNRS